MMPIKIRIFVIFVLFLLLIFIGRIDVYAFSPKDDYLWIEFGKCIKEKNGSLTLPLWLNYGRFPDEKREPRQLDGISAFYTLGETNDEGKAVFYDAQIQKDKKGYFVNIKSFKENPFIVFAQARKKQNKVTYQYLAKTSFFLFGHAFSKSKRTLIISPNGINRQLEICITPEFQCWPQTGNPIKITPIFDKDYLAQKAISLFDENMPSIDIMTDERGEYVYIPPEDKKLNWQGETEFKQAVIVAEETKGDIEYISSYTLLLHRSRFKNCKLLMGAVIFLGTMISVFLFVVVKRRRFKF